MVFAKRSRKPEPGDAIALPSSLKVASIALDRALSIATGIDVAIDADIDNDGLGDIRLDGLNATTLLVVGAGAAADITGLNFANGYADGARGARGFEGLDGQWGSNADSWKEHPKGYAGEQGQDGWAGATAAPRQAPPRTVERSRCATPLPPQRGKRRRRWFGGWGGYGGVGVGAAGPIANDGSLELIAVSSVARRQRRLALRPRRCPSIVVDAV